MESSYKAIVTNLKAPYIREYAFEPL